MWKIQLLKINPTFEQRLSPCTIILYERYIIFLHQLVEEGPIDQPSIRGAHSSIGGSMCSALLTVVNQKKFKKKLFII